MFTYRTIISSTILFSSVGTRVEFAPPKPTCCGKGGPSGSGWFFPEESCRAKLSLGQLAKLVPGFDVVITQDSAQLPVSYAYSKLGLPEARHLHFWEVSEAHASLPRDLSHE